MDEQEATTALILLLLMKKRKLLRLQQQPKGTRRYWVHPINQTRAQRGIYHTLVQEMRLYSDRHTRYLRMNTASFDHLLGMISASITKQDTIMRKAIEPGLKLAVTLHHLSEGASHSVIADHYRLGKSTVSQIIMDTCEAIWTILQPIYMKPPIGPTEWKQVAEGLVKPVNNSFITVFEYQSQVNNI